MITGVKHRRGDEAAADDEAEESLRSDAKSRWRGDLLALSSGPTAASGGRQHIRQSDDGHGGGGTAPRGAAGGGADGGATAGMLEAWEALASATDGQRVRASLFMRLPDAAAYPDYYPQTRNPIDLRTIRDRIERSRYASWQELGEDVQLLFANARAYNMEGSQVYEDAEELERMFRDAAAEQPQPPPPTSSRPAKRPRLLNATLRYGKPSPQPVGKLSARFTERGLLHMELSADLRVIRVSPNGPADRAGVKLGMQLLEFQG